jgi:hypothetical protein
MPKMACRRYDKAPNHHMNLKTLWTNLRLYDRLTLGYLWLTLLLVIFSPQAVPIRERLVLSHLAVTIYIFVLIYWTQLRALKHRHYVAPKWLQWLRDWHPLFWFSFLLFGEFTYLVTLVFPFEAEKYLIASDLWLFGQPPQQFIQTHVPWWGIELMAFAYWSYYPLVFGMTWRYYSSRSAEFSFVDFMNRLCLAFYLCYLLFIIIPARSPRHALNLNEQLQLTGGIFYNLIATMQNYVSVVGAAFPSSHVVVTWVAALTLWDKHRIAFWSLMPLVIALTLSIFVLQYHYVLDAVAGVILALIFEWLWRRFYWRAAKFVATNLQSAAAEAETLNSSATIGLRK